MKVRRLRVEPALLTWARETAGLSREEAAKALGIKRKVLQQWETLAGYPTARQLDTLCDRYKRPTAVFFLDRPPEEPAVPPDFRRLAPAERHPIGRSTLLALRRARWLQQAFLELEGNEDRIRRLALPKPPESHDARQLARSARELLGVSLKAQSDWKKPAVALNAWRLALNFRGVMVFQFHIDEEERVSGFSLTDPVPTIVLNTTDAVSRRIFTLAHEWSHILRLEPGMCWPRESARIRTDEAKAERARIEEFCDLFAAALLVPKDALVEHAAVAAFMRGESSIDEAVNECSKSFAVSRFVILRRFYDEGLIDRQRYWPIVQAWQAAFDRQRKSAKRRGGFQEPSKRVLTELGSQLVGRILDGLDQGTLPYSDAASILSIRLKHLDRLRDLLPGELAA